MSRAKKFSTASIDYDVESLYEGREGIVYARVSSKKQELEGSGLQSQEGRCVKDLASIGVPLNKVFLDSYTGGGDFMKRPAMRGLFAYIDAHPHKKFVVVFDDLKRFARDVEFHIKLRAAFEARGVILRCLNFSFSGSPAGKFAEIVMAAHGEMERLENRVQVVQKMTARFEAGYWPFPAKRGYTMVKDVMHGKISVPNDDSKILSRALEGFANGTLVRKIDVSRFLIEQGFYKRESRADKHLDAVTSFLRDPFYAGFIEFPQWGVTRRPGRHKAIISVETFELIQKRLKNDGLTKRIRTDISQDFPLRGLLVCAACGGHITAAWTKGRNDRFPYYICKEALACKYYRKSMKRVDVRDGFNKLLLKTALKNEVSKLLDKVFERVWDSEIGELQTQESVAERSKTMLEEQARQLTAMVAAAKSEKLRGLYEAQLEEIADKLEQIKEQSMNGIDFTTPYRTALGKASTMLKKPAIAWGSMSVIEQHRLFYFIFEQKLAYDAQTGYQTADIPTAARLFEKFVVENSPEVETGGIEPPSKI